MYADHGCRRAVASHVPDPVPDAIMAINEWLHWYHLFRNPEPDDDDVERLTDMGRALLGTLESVFPFQVKVGRFTWRSMWCNEKVHSILHAPRTLERMGRSQNVSCQVTETSHKGVKRKGARTNRNPATAGMSIMKTQLREAASQRMGDALDEPSSSVLVRPRPQPTMGWPISVQMDAFCIQKLKHTLHLPFSLLLSL